MKALVVYESMYGNTERIARAIAEGLSVGSRVEVVHCDELTDDKIAEFDLVVVGAPTHAFGLPKASTRRDAMQKVGREAPPLGLRERIDGLSPQPGTPVAAFATRIQVRGLPSRHAAKTIAKKLRALGCEIVTKPEAFLVDGTEGPVRKGELDRARKWGRTLLEGRDGRRAA